MDKPQIIGLGLSGLVGSRITDLLADQYEFVSLSHSERIDITKPESLNVIKQFRADYVLHLAAKTDVDGCEIDKSLGQEGDAWKINVLGTKNVANICRETGKKIIYFSTDFVFDGEKPENESYSEEDSPNPLNYYAKTKYEGEKEVMASGAEYVILRIAYPYRAKFEAKKDFVRAIKERLEGGGEIKAVKDHIFCPTFIDDLADVVDLLIAKDASGIYHSAGSQPLSPYDSALKIAEIFNLNKNLISKTTREEFFQNRAKRPFNLNLENGKISELGMEMKSFDEGLREIKKQLEI